MAADGRWPDAAHLVTRHGQRRRPTPRRGEPKGPGGPTSPAEPVQSGGASPPAAGTHPVGMALSSVMDRTGRVAPTIVAALSTSGGGAARPGLPSFPASFPPAGQSDAEISHPDPKMQLIVSVPFDFADCQSSLDKSIPATAFAIFPPLRVENAGIPWSFSAFGVRHPLLTILGKSGMIRPRNAGIEPSLAPQAAGTERGTPHREPFPAGAGGGLSLVLPGWKTLPWEGIAPALLPF
jgi:hypothetical protein